MVFLQKACKPQSYASSIFVQFLNFKTWTASRFQVVESAGMVKTAKGAEDFCLRSGER